MHISSLGLRVVLSTSDSLELLASRFAAQSAEARNGLRTENAPPLVAMPPLLFDYFAEPSKQLLPDDQTCV